jgi:hypothetical protein
VQSSTCHHWTKPAPPQDIDATVIAARTSYGKLLAWLAFQWRDLAALRTSHERGIPRVPEVWLLTATRRNLLNVARRLRMANDPQTRFLLTQDEALPDPVTIPEKPAARSGSRSRTAARIPRLLALDTAGNLFCGCRL